MLCEKCHEKEATVRITRIHNGSSETHNLCQDCANSFRADDPEAQDFSKAIFKLLADALMKHLGQNSGTEEDERAKKLSCPTCGKTYGEILEDGAFGCADCYESFEPYIRPMLLRMQGADTHTGKKAGASGKKSVKKQQKITEDVLNPKEELSVLSDRLKLAVSEENYEEAARLRDEINRLKEEQHG